MSLTSIRIKNFRQLNFLELDELSDITLIGGKNGVGKTSVLESMYLAATEVSASKFQELENRRHQRPLVGNQIDLSGEKPARGFAPWSLLFPVHTEKREMNFEYTNKQGEQFELAIKSPRDPLELSESTQKLLSQLPGLSNTIYADSALLLCETQCPVGKNHKHETLVFSQHNQIQQIKLNADRLPAPHAIGAGDVRFVTTQNWQSIENLNSVFSEIRKNGKIDLFITALKILDENIIGAEILEYQGRLQLHLNSPKRSVPISHAGDGALRIATYMATILGTSNSVILIDEIENGVHYSLLDDFWLAINKACQLSGSQLVASTHSAECIAAAARNVNNESFGYIRLDNDTGEETTATRYSGTDSLESLNFGISVR